MYDENTNVSTYFLDEKKDDKKGSSYYTTKYVAQELTQIKSLKSIILILKLLLKQNNLNTNYEQGLSSYSLIIMLISFIKSYNMVFYYNTYDILLKFLDWIIGFNANAFNEKPGDSVLKVLDPLTGNNLTKNCHKLRQI